MSLGKGKGRKNKKDELKSPEEMKLKEQAPENQELKTPASGEPGSPSDPDSLGVEPGGGMAEESGDSESVVADVDSLQEQLLRLKAEYANFKRRTDKEKTQLSNFIKASVYRDIIPVLDDFERFFEYVEKHENELDKGFVQGIELIHNSLLVVLKKHGIEPIRDEGVRFDPNLHEAMLTVPVEKEEDENSVKKILEVGYRMGDIIIRPAKVAVGAAKEP